MAQGMDCARVRRLWCRWIDGSLPTDQMAAVAEHLGACRFCAGRWRQADPVGALAAFGAPPQAPPGLETAVLAALPSCLAPTRAGVPLGPAALAAVLVAALWWERLRFAVWFVPLAGTGLAGVGAAVGAAAGVIASAAPIAAAVLSWSVPALFLFIVLELPVCAHLLRPRTR